MFEGIEFLNKEMFWLFLLLPLAILWYVFKHKKQTKYKKNSKHKKLTYSILKYYSAISTIFKS